VVRAAVQAGQTTAAAFGKVLHQLWHEVMGFTFLAMAGIGGIALTREWAKYEAGRSGAGRVIVAACFCVTFAYFGISSFWRVRRKS
jgi:hypothetical protein